MNKEILEKIKLLKEKGEVYDGSYDSVFKSIIQDLELKEFTAFIISNINKRLIKEEKMIFINT